MASLLGAMGCELAARSTLEKRRFHIRPIPDPANDSRQNVIIGGFGAETVRDAPPHTAEAKSFLDGRASADPEDMVAGGGACPGPQARGRIPSESPHRQLQHTLGKRRHNSEIQ